MGFVAFCEGLHWVGDPQAGPVETTPALESKL